MLTSTGPSPAGWMRSPPWPTRQPSSRTAARPTAKEGSRRSLSGRWPTFRSNQDWASWTGALPPTSPNQRPRTENVYKDLQYITTTPQLVFADIFFQGKMSSSIRLSSTVYAISCYHMKEFISWYFCLLFLCWSLLQVYCMCDISFQPVVLAPITLAYIYI